MNRTILLLVGISLIAAVPQNDVRTRPRGSRRFSLATPGFQSVNSRTLNENVERESSTTLDEELEQPKTRSRGTSLLRRGRPNIQKPNQSSSQPNESAFKTNSEPEVETISKPKGRIRLRRPSIRKTTTTTTTIIPELETNSEIPLLTEDELTQIIDKGLDTESKGLVGIKNDQEIHAIKSSGINEETENELLHDNSNKHNQQIANSKLPRPKLRPIPVSIRQRPRENFVKVVPVEIHMQKEEETIGSLDTQAPSQHRFANRATAPRIQSRARGPRRRQNNPPANEEVQIDARSSSDDLQKPRNHGTARLRVPGRLTSRRRTLQPTTEIPVENEPILEVEIQSENFGRRPRRG